METWKSGGKRAVLHAQIHRWGLSPTETCNSGLKSQFCMHKATGEGWNPYTLDIVVLSTLIYVHKSTDEVWDTLRLVILMHNSLFWMHKNTDEGWDPYRLVYFGYKAVVLIAQNHWWGMRPIETSNSGAKHTVCMHKTTGEVWEPLRLVILFLKSLFCMQKTQMRAGTNWN